MKKTVGSTRIETVGLPTSKMDVPQKIRSFSTKDFWCAASLVASGIGVVRLDWDGPQAFFVFEDRGLCEAFEEKYWDKTLMVSAKAFTDALHQLKARLRQKDGKNG